jgi:integrin beta 3
VIGAKAAAAKAAAEAGDDDERGGGFLERLRTQRKLRMVSLVSLAVVVLVVLPAFFGLRAASSDPVFSSLDSLEVPAWAEQKVDDKSDGSRWCFIDCTFRERTAESQRSIEETTAAYTSALTSAGWAPWKVVECPEVPIPAGDSTTYSCFKRDEFTLDLRVSQPECQVDQVAANDPSVAGATAPPPPAKGQCVGSAVSIKVQNAIADSRGKPDPQKSPLIGETPDTVITEDPLLEPTPSAS